jgi:hypothetical protein
MLQTVKGFCETAFDFWMSYDYHKGWAVITEECDKLTLRAGELLFNYPSSPWPAHLDIASPEVP